jgi:hypothetical protein
VEFEMTREEQEYWCGIVKELQDVPVTVAEIAEHCGVNDRQVWRWKDGDRPMGFAAVRLYLLHVKRCPPGRCPPLHVQSTARCIVS